MLNPVEGYRTNISIHISSLKDGGKLDALVNEYISKMQEI